MFQEDTYMKNLSENEKEINPSTMVVLDENVRWFCGKDSKSTKRRWKSQKPRTPT